MDYSGGGGGQRVCWPPSQIIGGHGLPWPLFLRLCACDSPLMGDSVRDHCHITGEYRGAAHNACNLKLRLNTKTTSIPVVFHNLRGYDSHLLMQAISKVEGRVSRRSTSPSASDSCASLTVPNSCYPPLTIWLRRTRQRLFRWVVVFDGTAPEKTGPNFEGPGKSFRHQIIK